MAAQTPELKSTSANADLNARADLPPRTLTIPRLQSELTTSAVAPSPHSVQRSECLTSNGRSEAIDLTFGGTVSVGTIDQVDLPDHILQQLLARAKRDTHAAHERHLCQIGADLHDGPAQLLALAILQLETLAATNPSGAALVQDTISDALREIRDISVGLVLPELDRRNAVAAVRLAVETYERRTGMSVTLDDAALPATLQPSKALNICLYRFIQEGLQNGFKHAHGAAQTITVGLAQTLQHPTPPQPLPSTPLAANHSHLTLIARVRDSRPVTCIASGNTSDHSTWRRTDGTSTGLGLAGLKERIAALDGTFEIISTVGSTELVARFLLNANAIK